MPRGPAAAYFTLHGGPADATLVSISSDVSIRAEMHESMMSGSMSSMKPIQQVALPAGSEVVFAPGGKHVMLFDVNPGIKPGAPVPLLFTFADGQRITYKATAVGAGDGARELSARPDRPPADRGRDRAPHEACSAMRSTMRRCGSSQRKWAFFQPRETVMAPTRVDPFPPAGHPLPRGFRAQFAGRPGAVHPRDGPCLAAPEGRHAADQAPSPSAGTIMRSGPACRCERYGIEQQAEIVRHAFLALRRGGAPGDRRTFARHLCDGASAPPGRLA